jgi:class 3 adenylate cyclase
VREQKRALLGPRGLRERRLAAIMVGDIVGYSTMMEKSEEKTAARLATCQALISEKVASPDGSLRAALSRSGFIGAAPRVS